MTNHLGKLVFLGAICATLAQTEQITVAPTEGVILPTYKTLNYDEIVKIVQSPLFRSSNPPLTSEYTEGVPSYLPLTYEQPEPASESTVTGKSLLAPVPSLVLEVPKAEAVDSFNIKNVPEPTQIFASYRPPAQLLGIKQPQAFIPQQTVGLLNFPLKPLEQSAVLSPYLPVNPHSKQLDLPLPPSAPIPSTDLQVPPALQAYNDQFNIDYSNPYKNIDPAYLPRAYQSPRTESIKPLRVPTNVYPKKYDANQHDHKPKKPIKHAVEIVGEEIRSDAPVAKSSRSQKYSVAPTQAGSLGNLEKQRLKFDDAQKKIQTKKEEDSKKQQSYVDATVARAKGEQDASETGFTSFQDESESQDGDSGISDVAHGVGGERTDFQMHGQHGPHSYKFGYDTGEGKNRHFRYEERDNEGVVKGHYGFYDKHGKLQIVNYDAHPHHGFHAEGSFGKA